MSEIAYTRYLFKCRPSSLEVYFQYNNSVIFSTNSQSEQYFIDHFEKCIDLIVITKCSLENYNGPFETKRFCRGDILTVQGILSFFTGFPITIYNSPESSAGIFPFEYEEQETHLIIDSKDYSSDLEKMLIRINDEPELIISLLDRWRKAIYLKEESCDADLYYDEATLSFFHIMELFGDTVNSELKEKLNANLEKMLKEHYKNFYMTDNQVVQMVSQNRKAISSILIGDYLTLGIKIKFFLEKYNIFDENIAFFIDNMIKIRNSIAHGRITFQNMFIWPLPPFFNLAKDSYENIDFLFFLSAHMISRYIGIKCWGDEWEEAKQYLLPPLSVLESYLYDTVEFTDINSETLCFGNRYNITWRTIFNHYLKNPKRIEKNLENKLKGYFITTEISEVNAQDIFNISLIFSDSDIVELSTKAQNNIRSIVSNKWYEWSNIKDAFSYLEFYGVHLKWYKEYLNIKDH